MEKTVRNTSAIFAGLTAATLMATAACTGYNQEMPTDPIAADYCPSFQGEAWINAMPGPDASPDLHVVVTLSLADDENAAGWGLSKIEPAGDERTLVLQLGPVGPDTSPTKDNTVRFTQPAAPGRYDRIIISCVNGKSVTIEPIPTAY